MVKVQVLEVHAAASCDRPLSIDDDVRNVFLGTCFDQLCVHEGQHERQARCKDEMHDSKTGKNLVGRAISHPDQPLER
jgi:hypothetical protein